MEALIIILLVILGLIFGSFFCCMGYRIPNKIKTTYPNSFCPKCKKELKWYMNIPVISFIILKGRCAYCKEPIDFIYIFTEIATGLLFLCNYVMFDFTMNFWISMIITSILMITIVSDFVYFYISDRVLILGGIVGIAVLYIFSGFEYTFHHIIYGIIIFAFMYLIKIIGNKLFKKESLGDGDIKLMGVIGILLGLMNSFVTLFIGSVIGLIFSLIIMKKNKEGIIPFGPFLLMGALITLYFSSLIDPLISSLFV